MITPLDSWMTVKTGCPPVRKNLIRYQLEKIRETVTYMKKNSPYYRRLLQDFQAEEIADLSDLDRWPLTGRNELKQHGSRMVCVSQNEISRVVSITSSGTTGGNKRIWFTEADQELTRDFFHHGMKTFTSAGDTVMIGMPGFRPGSIGPLLREALSRFGARGIVAGPLGSLSDAADLVTAEGVTHFVGLPKQAAALAAFLEYSGRPHDIRIWLLTADYVSAGIRERLGALPGTEVYEHWGMTETGLGGGVFCEAKSGYHMRETDICFEIINPLTAKVLPSDQWGEIVITTLTRRGMPLFRYRTGDLGRWLSGPCPCGSSLGLMDRIRGRIDDYLIRPDGSMLTRAEWEDRVFYLDGLIDYRMNTDAPSAELFFLKNPVSEAVEKLQTLLQGVVKWRVVKEWRFEGAQKGIWKKE